MNKSALKSFATEARRELLEKVQLQARKLGITPDAIQQATLESSDAIFIDDKQLSNVERRQRNKLIERINEIGYDRIMEEAAYTWFNRFIALRYMEVNNYLPTKIRVFSSVNSDSNEPDMMKEALSLDLPIDKELVYNLKIENKTDDLFKYLIKLHCNDLNRYMPFMFETIEGYIEILFPEGLLGTDTFVRKMTDVDAIPEEDWTNVEIVGWLYQYYISEENERVIKAKKRYKAEEIPYATQLFTPEWIVRYMVQNALGRYWIESHPEHRDLIKNWEFYLENPNPEPDFEEKLAPYINKELNVEDIKCFDPAMGSGHILSYMFDVLYEIYSKCGYMEREIPRLIIEKNLYGLDIDDRAYQLASFTVVMKALQYNKRFLRSIERDGLEMNLATIQETNSLTDEDISFLVGEKYDKGYQFLKQFIDAKSIGSLIKLVEFDKDYIQNKIEHIEKMNGDLFQINLKDRLLILFKQLLKQASIMSLKYDVFVTNPPYAGNKYLTPEVTHYLSANYPNVKFDLFSAFIESGLMRTKINGHMGFMTPYVWMFISQYEKLRGMLIQKSDISSLIQLEYSSFEGATVPICTFTLRNCRTDMKGEFIKLSNFKGAEIQPIKTLEAINNPSVSYRFTFEQVNFDKIPGSPIAYWLSEDFISVFSNYPKINSVSQTKHGSTLGDNNRFLRLWHEVENNKNYKWLPCLKGGAFRKWYGNHDYVINWENGGQEIKETGRATIRSESLLFTEGISWSNITSGKSSFRIMESGYFFESSSSVCFPNEYGLYILGLLNTKLSELITQILNPTLHLQAGNVADMPFVFIKEELTNVEDIAKENIALSKHEWDSFENSWEFKKHPFINYNSKKIKDSYMKWDEELTEIFNKVKQNEIKLNKIFNENLNFLDAEDIEIKDADITIRKANIERDTKSFISYAIGCSFGRYSLDEDGLIYAGGEFNLSRYKTFSIDQDNILPVLSGAYFADDIVSRFVEFVRMTYTSETLEENLDFITNVIGRKTNETARETLRRYFLTDFYKDHVQTYKKRPIYWLFTSGKEKAFNCLIYMHRYDKTTLSRIRTDYVHEVQNRMDAEKNDLLNIINGDSTVKEITAAKKELKSLEKKIDELKKYDELLHHMADQQLEIDLDDGVKHNYELFKGLVAPIK